VAAKAKHQHGNEVGKEEEEENVFYLNYDDNIFLNDVRHIKINGTCGREKVRQREKPT